MHPNLWEKGGLDDYIFYVCQQCTFRANDYGEFQNHQIQQHYEQYSDPLDAVKIEQEDSELLLEPKVSMTIVCKKISRR